MQRGWSFERLFDFMRGSEDVGKPEAIKRLNSDQRNRSVSHGAKGPPPLDLRYRNKPIPSLVLRLNILEQLAVTIYPCNGAFCTISLITKFFVEILVSMGIPFKFLLIYVSVIV